MSPRAFPEGTVLGFTLADPDDDLDEAERAALLERIRTGE